MEPTLAGFWQFIQNGLMISETYLPSNSVWPGYAFNVAMALVNPQIQQACYAGAPLMYQLAVYNLAAHNLIVFAQDVPDIYVPNSEPPTGFFAQQRQAYGIFAFQPGTVSASNDEGSGVSIAVVEGLKNLTASQLGLLKTPYGLTYLGIAQSVGSLWGLS